MLPQKLLLLLMAIVVVAGYYDIRYRRIPNWLVLPALVVGVGLNAFLYGTAGLKQAGLGFGLAMLVYFPLYLLRGMGAGDVKLMAAIGALVGWANWLLIFILSGLLGGVLALALMLAKGRFRRTLWNTGYIVWEMVHLRAPHMRHEELDVRNPRAFTLPHGAVIALACLLYAGIATFVAAQFGPGVAGAVADVFARARDVNLKSCLQLFLYLQILDFLTTMVGLKIGCRELSPFIRELMHAGPEMGVAASKAIAVGLAAVCVWLNRGYLIGWVNYGYAALIVWNLAIVLRQHGG